MVLKRINRIVGGTDHLHIHLFHDSAGGEGILSQQIITLVPDLIGGGWRQQLTCNTKRSTQPKWVQWYNGLPIVCGTVAAKEIKFLAIGRITGTQTLRHALVRIARHLHSDRLSARCHTGF